jgi:hypothetical protein
METKARSAQNPAELFEGILIQVIHTTWDKSARGGKLAGQRNAVPLALAVPVSICKIVVAFTLLRNNIGVGQISSLNHPKRAISSCLHPTPTSTAACR